MPGKGTKFVARAVSACVVIAMVGVVAPPGPAGATAQTPVPVNGPALGLTPFVPVVGDVPSPTTDSGGVPLGAIRTMAGNYTPSTSVAAAGQVLPASSYPNGQAVFGSTFGGDGSTTFGVPDLQGRTPV